jgi:hypothetical protein
VLISVIGLLLASLLNAIRRRLPAAALE